MSPIEGINDESALITETSVLMIKLLKKTPQTRTIYTPNPILSLSLLQLPQTYLNYVLRAPAGRTFGLLL